MLNQKTQNIILQQLENAENIVILSHVNPDGDAIGSSLGLAILLKKMLKNVRVVLPNDAPEFLKWLPGFDMVVKHSENKEGALQAVKNADMLFFLDFNEPNRLAKLEKVIQNSEAFKVLIDHHQRPLNFADIIISESWRGSVGEMVYVFIEKLNKAQFIDKDIATNLYVAIMTDTGNFRHSSSYPEIFSIVSKLLDVGIEKDQIFSRIYDSYSESRMKLMGYCMSEKLKVLHGGRTAYISLSIEELDKYNHQIGDTEGFVNIPFSIQGIEVCALFIEKKDHVKVSLRSKGDFSVDELASRYFNGGGHVNAAGGEDKLPLEETLLKFEKIMKTDAR